MISLRDLEVIMWLYRSKDVSNASCVEVAALIRRICTCRRKKKKRITDRFSERHVDVCYDLPSQVTNNFSVKMIIVEKTLCFQYHPERKWQSFQWKETTFPRPNVTRYDKWRQCSSLSSISRILFTLNSFYKAEQSTKFIMWKYWRSYVKLWV
jgi:hypothetical protein